MGKINGFMEYERKENEEIPVKQRIRNFNEFHTPLDKKTRKEQASRCMNCGVPYCQWGKPIGRFVVGCPLNNLIPEFNDALYKDNEALAIKRLLKTNNFPEFTSRVCPALCEKACVCNVNDEPVSTKDNEFEIIETAFSKGLMKPLNIKDRTDLKVAVVGSGPAGLAAADQLNHRGYNVSVFEKNDRFGGLLMYGIPNMKLDKSVIDRRIELMKKEGVEFYPNYEVKDKNDADKLLKEYDAVILACGSEKPRSLNLEGMDSKGIHYAVEFLSESTKALLNDKKSKIDAKNKKVVIVGGGDTGNDCVGTCIRMKAKSVMQLEMLSEPPLERTKDNPWPEWPNVKKTDYGQSEAIEVFGEDPRLYDTTISSLRIEKGKLTGVEIVSLQTVTEDGKKVLRQIEESKKMVDCDLLLIAAGFVGCNDEIVKAFYLSLDKGKAIADNYQIQDKLFTCGDMRKGQSLVVHAINEGRLCAEAVDRYLSY
ncbi:MAG: glutamate synthase subunit beta [Erysipelotrichaceae bacterium]|nr:glutamate synthase subunit beta [Erysipelotrichaceae bacterium]